MLEQRGLAEGALTCVAGGAMHIVVAGCRLEMLTCRCCISTDQRRWAKQQACILALRYPADGEVSLRPDATAAADIGESSRA